jgi:hypothetical protein
LRNRECLGGTSTQADLPIKHSGKIDGLRIIDTPERCHNRLRTSDQEGLRQRSLI